MKQVELKKSFYYLFVMILVLIPETSFAKKPSPWVGADFEGYPCGGSSPNGWYGPYDYTIPDQKAQLGIVNAKHFTPNVENHIKGESGYLGADLNYTLMAGPNHHRALLSIIQLQMKLDKKIIVFQDKGNLLPTPVECYFQRAINFSLTRCCYLFIIWVLSKREKQIKRGQKVLPKGNWASTQISKNCLFIRFIIIGIKRIRPSAQVCKTELPRQKGPTWFT